MAGQILPHLRTVEWDEELHEKTDFTDKIRDSLTSDVVLGQILRYMGYLNEHWVDNGQTVRGVIVALEDDQKLRYDLKIVPSVAFYRYQIAFSLHTT